ncbi:Na+/H+ antiporter NhaC [Psychrobacillus sp. BL-248-WT-3]|uniref:Na+/H+ antiporter NhaC n=1 Tax=Psychrobacillus sp. BL-248-WT-3 TaxID=2725306 RepID=UPI00146DCC9D|nr:Na+/H+ antiporter NhaC [Psychrobacillus sp. BL-248-WT-3]NME07182.1 Na+/H+ antiporter NhaC [Psychrobacillus sp. BL-248-WT-3]
MFRIRSTISPSFSEAALLSTMIIAIMALCIIKFDSVPHMPILLAILLLITYGLMKKVPYKKLEEGLTDGAKAGLGAIFIFFFIGILISSLMMSGTIPTLIHLGFQFITPHFFYAIVFLVTCIVGLSIGSSLTTVATIGVAFIGMASAMDISLAITAGAIVSGAFFGDKMSPLSDTTNLASAIVQVDLFEHIRNMGWTTIPAFIISLIGYGILSPNKELQQLEQLNEFQAGLLQTGMIHWYTLIPLVLLVILSIKKVPAILSLAFTSVVAILISYFHHSFSFGEVLNILFYGFTSSTGMEAIDSLLSRGGINSMMFTIGLVLLALSMGGLLFTLGIVQSLLMKVESSLRKVSSVVAATAFTAIGVNTLIGEQYLSILLTGEAFQAQFKKVGLANKNLARVMEDAGTVVNPLVPWSVCGIFITNVLAVTTLEYLPFAFFCLLSPILTILFGFTGKTLTYIEEK